MKVDAVVNGREAKLAIDAGRFRYERDGVVIEREFSVEPVTPGTYSVLIDGRSYDVTAPGLVAQALMRATSTMLSMPGVETGLDAARMSACATQEIRVNGRPFSVEVFDPRSLRARKAGGSGEGRQNVAAMMPGKVVRVLVEAGDQVEADQGLIVVEAMKMQNEMKSPKAGRVVEVKTKPDATVAAGEVLIVIE